MDPVPQQVLEEFQQISQRLADHVAQGTAWGPDAMADHTWLLCYHFLRADPTAALNLWNGIPKVIRDGHPEFEAVRKVGICVGLWEAVEFYQAVLAYQWTPPIIGLIVQLTEKKRVAIIQNLEGSYGAISKTDLRTVLGLSGKDVDGVVACMGGWQYSGWFWGGLGGRMVKMNGGQREGFPTYYYSYRYTERDMECVAWVLIGLAAFVFLLVVWQHFF